MFGPRSDASIASQEFDDTDLLLYGGTVLDELGEYHLERGGVLLLHKEQHVLASDQTKCLLDDFKSFKEASPIGVIHDLHHLRENLDVIKLLYRG
jgi:hypothetical protein